MLYVLVTLAVSIVALIAFASTRPDDFRLERSIQIAASDTALLALIDDLHRWSEWSPWDKLDPTMKRGYDGPARGVGAIYTWDGTGKVGAGRMEVSAVSATSVTIQLDFMRPFKASNVTVFTLEPAGDGTKVTWAMTGKNALMAKVMGLFMNMDEMVGKDFATGLANMKAVAESPRVA